MLENYITQVRHSKGVSSEREAFVSRAAQASAAACIINNKMFHPLIPLYQLVVRENIWLVIVKYANSIAKPRLLKKNDLVVCKELERAIN